MDNIHEASEQDKPAHRVDVLTVALAAGSALAIYVFGMGIISLLSGRGRGIVGLLSEWYIGFSASIAGSLIGAAWGFADGFLAGLLIAWLYNLIKKMRK